MIVIHSATCESCLRTCTLYPPLADRRCKSCREKNKSPFSLRMEFHALIHALRGQASEITFTRAATDFTKKDVWRCTCGFTSSAASSEP